MVCLIAGDGNIFSRDLIVRGFEGGQCAARMLADSIRAYLRENDFYETHYELSIYSFLNRKGLASALLEGKHIPDRICMDNFIVGFNQTGERFFMVDVGHGKERVDAKLRGKFLNKIKYHSSFNVLTLPIVALLRDQALSPSTQKIFLGREFLSLLDTCDIN